MSNFAQGILGAIAAVAVVLVLVMLIAHLLSRPISRGKRPRS